MIVLLWTALTAGPALASECPYPQPTSVDARVGTLTVDGDRRYVRGATRRAAVETDLRSCGHEDAVAHLREWRRQRRLTNTWAVVGVLTGGWGFIGCAITAPAAGRAADALEMALLDRE